jgi:nicotianamine synthase
VSVLAADAGLEADPESHAAADAEAADLCARISAVVESLDALGDLRPEPRTDALFSELVSLCQFRAGLDIRRVLADPSITALAPRLRQLCAVGEYQLETHWANRIVAAADAGSELALFPYVRNYQQLTELEIHTLLGLGLRRTGLRRVAFLGGGPLPLSGLLLSRGLDVPVDVVEVDSDAVALSCAVLHRLDAAGSVHVLQGDARRHPCIAGSDVVVLASLVGVSQADKRAVLSAVADQMRPGAVLVVRSSYQLRSLLYTPVDLNDLLGFRPLALLHPFTAVVNSLIIAERT